MQISTKTLIDNVATGAGWPFYHLLTSDKQPYSIGNRECIRVR